MSIEFQNKWYLLLLIPLIIFTLIPFGKMLLKKKVRSRHIVSFVCRLLAIILLVFAISGCTTVKKTDKNSIIVLADLSDSTKSLKETYENYVKIAGKYADKKTKIGLVTFGYNSYYEVPLSNKFTFTGFETAPSGNYTDIYSAIVKAAAMMQEGSNKRIILLTDGKQNIGELKDAANMLTKKGIRLDAILSETGVAESEVQISDIKVPDVLYQGEKFNITVTVESTKDCSAELTLYSDGIVSAKQEVRLSKGTNRFVFSDQGDNAGIVTYSAEIATKEDSLKKNNSVYSFVNVIGTPEILIVDGTGNESHELVKIIGDRVKYTVVLPDHVPDNINDLRKYSSVVLMNTTKKQLPENWDTLLDVYVRQMGRGLLTTGGNKMYAMGGWIDSKLEEILPVDMQTKDEAHLADMSLIILIDNSGSMGSGTGSYLETAKQGAINAVGAIKQIDEVGVIVFSDNAVWVAKPTSAENAKNVQNKISTIGPGGGTMINAALHEAVAALKKSDKSVKNILLLTDGQPADGEEAKRSGLLKDMVDENIKVSSIAVGDFAESDLLRYFSDGTGGSYYLVKSPEELPNIIYQETLKMSNEGYVKNITFTPSVKDYSAILSGVSGIPEIDGYVLTEVKDMAYNILEEEEGKTVLASWQYGLGKAVSLTTDLNGKWSSKLLSSENGRKMIDNMISWILPGEDTQGGGTLSIERTGDRGIVTVKSESQSENSEVKATILSPSGKESEITLSASGIGEFEGDFLLEEEGSYVVLATQKDQEGNVLLSKENALAVKYSDEYDMFVENDGSVAILCGKTGGSADWTEIESIISVKLNPVKESLEYTIPLMIIALCLLMIDIAVRRLNIDFAKIFGLLKKKVPEKVAETVTEPAKPVKMAEKKDPPKNKTKTNAVNTVIEKEKSKPTATSAQKPKDPASSVSSLLKEKENMQRKKM